MRCVDFCWRGFALQEAFEIIVVLLGVERSAERIGPTVEAIHTLELGIL